MAHDGGGGGSTTTYAVERARFRVDTSDRSIAALVDDLFQDLRSHAAAPLDEVLCFALHAVDGIWQVRLPGGGIQRSTTLSGALGLLLAGVNIAALDASPDRLHLHAAGACLGDRGVVIAAPRGTGKTTTVAALVERGWSFMTDETVYLTTEDEALRGSPRPLSIKPHGRGLLKFLAPHIRPDAADEAEFQFVAMGAAGVDIVGSALPHVVVILRRPAGSGKHCAATASPLHPADATVALVGETLDAGRFGRAAMPRLARLAAASHCVHLLRGDRASTADMIEQLVRADAVTPMPVREHPPSNTIRREVVSVRVGDRVVVHHTGSGVLLALDDLGGAVWEQLGGWALEPRPDLTRAGVSDFVEQLRDFDLLGDHG